LSDGLQVMSSTRLYSIRLPWRAPTISPAADRIERWPDSDGFGYFVNGLIRQETKLSDGLQVMAEALVSPVRRKILAYDQAVLDQAVLDPVAVARANDQPGRRQDREVARQKDRSGGDDTPEEPQAG
jgi:hypothetical protein